MASRYSADSPRATACCRRLSRRVSACDSRSRDMPFELLVALRYLREGRAQTWLILTGVGVGVGVIIFLSALISGLQTSLIARTLGTQAHVVVRPREEMPRVLPAAGRLV